MVSNILYAYLAGCLDCDGSFGIKRSTYELRVRGDAWQPMFSERVGFAQVKPEVPKLLKETFGGGYSLYTPKKGNSKPSYRWCATNKRAVECVKAVLPYLRIKKAQAELLLELRQLTEKPKIQQGTRVAKSRWGTPMVIPRRIVNPEITKAKESLYNKIRILNHIPTQQPLLIGKAPKRR